MLRFALLAILVGSAETNQCYKTLKLNNDKPNTRDGIVPCQSFCRKNTTQSGSSTFSDYDCDWDNRCYTLGVTNGKCKQVQFGQVYFGASSNLCCCSGDLCNSAYTVPKLVTVMLTLFLSVFCE